MDDLTNKVLSLFEKEDTTTNYFPLIMIAGGFTFLLAVAVVCCGWTRGFKNTHHYDDEFSNEGSDEEDTNMKPQNNKSATKKDKKRRVRNKNKSKILFFSPNTVR